MTDNATRLLANLSSRVAHQSAISLLAIEEIERTVTNPRTCVAWAPGRDKSPAKEMMDALQIVKIAWPYVCEFNRFYLSHQLGHVVITEEVLYDDTGDEINCDYSANHFELADLSIVAPALIQWLITIKTNKRVGVLHFSSSSLSRHEALVDLDQFHVYHKWCDTISLTNNVDQWISDNAMFCDEGLVMGMRSRFHRHVAQPLKRSLELAYDDHEAALESASECAWPEWADAQRRYLENIHE